MDAPAASRPTPAAGVALDAVTVARHGRDGARLVLLDGISWRVQAGELWVVLGPNGAGKSTLLQLAGGVIHPTEGSVEVLGHRLGRVDMRALRERIGHVDAATARELKRGLNGLDVVLSGAFGSLAPQRRRLGAAHTARADRLLTMTGSTELRERRFDDCSQGERQRLLLGRALMAGGPDSGPGIADRASPTPASVQDESALSHHASHPDLLLLDEPTAGLDLPSRERFLGAVMSIARRWSGLPTITVTHHLEEIPPTTTHALLLREGKVLAVGPVDEVLTSDPVSRCFGLAVTVARSNGRWSAHLDADADGWL